MKYLLFLCFSCSLLLISCSNQEISNEEITKDKDKVTEEVKLLLEKGQFNNAGSLTREARNKTKDKSDIEYYNRLYDYIGLKELYKQKRYATLIENYIDSPIKDKLLQKEVVDMLIDSFGVLIEKEQYALATKHYNSLDAESKSSLGEMSEKLEEIALEVKQQNEKKQEESSQVSSISVVDRYLQYMKEGNYAKITGETTTNLSNVGSDFFNLSIAYDHFYNNNTIVYIQGKESLPEVFLNGITEPLPEVQPYIDQLRGEINKKKSSSVGTYGVQIGMTKEDVLSSS